MSKLEYLENKPVQSLKKVKNKKPKQYVKVLNVVFDLFQVIIKETRTALLTSSGFFLLLSLNAFKTTLNILSYYFVINFEQVFYELGMFVKIFICKILITFNSCNFQDLSFVIIKMRKA